MRRRALLGGILLAAAAAAAAYLFVFRDTTSSEAPQGAPVPTSVIGTGKAAVGVAANGRILSGQLPPSSGSLPALPLSSPPKTGRLSGPALEQARVLGAAPAALRACIAGSNYGESGVDVHLRSGIELRFGNASRARLKWQSAAAVLADPSITALDYVDLHSPGRPAYYGSGHSLPPASSSPSSGCGG